MDRSVRIGRRRVALGIGAAAVVVPAGAATAAPAPSTVSDHDPPIDVSEAHGLSPIGERERAALGTLVAGATFVAAGGARFRIATAHAIRGGAMPLVVESLEERPLRFAIEVFRRDDHDPQTPVARTAELALVIVNRGDGARATGPLEGLATRALALELAARDRAIAPALLTRRQRDARHPMGVFHVPV